jgi:hypothetical protein
VDGSLQSQQFGARIAELLQHVIIHTAGASLIWGRPPTAFNTQVDQLAAAGREGGGRAGADSVQVEQNGRVRRCGAPKRRGLSTYAGYDACSRGFFGLRGRVRGKDGRYKILGDWRLRVAGAGNLCFDTPWVGMSLGDLQLDTV